MAECHHSHRGSREGLLARCISADSTEWLAKGRFFFVLLQLMYWPRLLEASEEVCYRKMECVTLTGESENPTLQNVLPLVLGGGGKTKSLCWEMWDQEFKSTYKYSFRFKLQQKGKARLNLRKMRDLHVSTARLRNAIIHFWSFLNIFWNVCQYKEVERCGVSVWTTGVKRERGDILKDICITRILLLLWLLCCSDYFPRAYILSKSYQRRDLGVSLPVTFLPKKPASLRCQKTVCYFIIVNVHMDSCFSEPREPSSSQKTLTTVSEGSLMSDPIRVYYMY